MPGKQLLLYWDPVLDGEFRRAFEAALGALDVAASDGAEVDVDTDDPPVALALVSASGESPHARPDILVLAGPGEFRSAQGALRLEAKDVANRSRRWLALVEQLRTRLGRASLDRAPEDIAVQLDDANQRLAEAERARATFELERNDALRGLQQIEKLLAAGRADAESLRHEIERLTALNEDSVYALQLVPDRDKDIVQAAREHVWRARLAAARGDEAGVRHPDALNWAKPDASYSGETLNARAHGFGVMIFRTGKQIASTYRGQFVNGLRHGHGASIEADGHVWCGEWRDGEAVGLGRLETPDGRRFEGRTIAGEDGAPRKELGFIWNAPGRPGSIRQVHTPLSPLLPAPDAQAAGG